MEPGITIAIGALILSIFNFIFTAKTYAKNRRLEFRQRQDRLAQKISELNDRNTEFHLISARYSLIAVRNAALPLQGEQAERNTALIATINEQREGVERGIKLWDANIEKLHFIYSKLTLEHASQLESMITFVQVASDNLKKAINGYLSTLYILETTNAFMKTTLDETDEKMRQINQEFDRKVDKLNLDFERTMEKLEKK